MHDEVETEIGREGGREGRREGGRKEEGKEGEKKREREKYLAREYIYIMNKDVMFVSKNEILIQCRYNTV